MLNIVIPMAGAGSRFAKAGYSDPKPLIKIHNIPMIRLVIENLRPECDHQFIFIIQQEHNIQYDLSNKLRKWAPNCEIVLLDGLTEGAACTVLAAKKYINNNNSLMIANSDQFVDIDINKYIAAMKNNAGLIMTMKADDPKWSFVGLDEYNLVTNVVEKQVISNEATVGIYNFAHGVDFVNAAEHMIAEDQRVNNEFYVAPVYNYLIADRKKIGIFNVGSEANGMYGLGIPTDLDLFEKLDLSRQAVMGLTI